MSKRAKLEAFRRRLARKVDPTYVLDETAKELILVAYYMPQYKIEDLLEMTPWEFRIIAEELAEIKRKENEYTSIKTLR
ncbi:MAG: hypothetical protein ACTSUF_02145 [Candidatus Heimdallarchaeaceae archaeon]